MQPPSPSRFANTRRGSEGCSRLATGGTSKALAEPEGHRCSLWGCRAAPRCRIVCTPQVLSAYHRAATELAEAAGVDVIDRYGPTFQLPELAVAEHYGEPSAHAAAHLILDWLKARGVIAEARGACPQHNTIAKPTAESSPE